MIENILKNCKAPKTIRDWGYYRVLHEDGPNTKVKELTGKEAILDSIVDSSILGGFILRVGDIQYDASISNKLNVIKRQFNS